MKKVIITLLLFVPVCLFSQEYSDSAKMVIKRLATQQIQYLYNGKITKYFKMYSQNYTDFEKDTINFDEWHEKLQKRVSKKLKTRKAISKLIDTSKLEIMSYEDVLAKKGKGLNVFSFVFQKGDYVVFYPLKEETSLPSWFGIFRLENDEWKIIAGNVNMLL